MASHNTVRRHCNRGIVAGPVRPPVPTAPARCMTPPGCRDHPAFDQVAARAEADGADIGLTFALGHQQQRGDDVREETH